VVARKRSRQPRARQRRRSWKKSSSPLHGGPRAATSSISASVLTAEAIEDKAVTNLYALQYAAPAVTISGFGSANVFNIRGIGRSQVDIDVPSGVVIYRDGAPTLAGYFQTSPSTTWIRSRSSRPAGNLCRQECRGGAVFINSKDPELGGVSGMSS